jgi:hypothetical protein
MIDVAALKQNLATRAASWRHLAERQRRNTQIGDPIETYLRCLGRADGLDIAIRELEEACS